MLKRMTSTCPMEQSLSSQWVCLFSNAPLSLEEHYFVTVVNLKTIVVVSTTNGNVYILNSCPTQGQVEGWDVNPLYWRSVNSKDAGHQPRGTVTAAGELKWKEMNEKNVEKWWNGICGRRKGRNAEKILTRLHFVHHETHMERPRDELGTPDGGERLTAYATV